MVERPSRQAGGSTSSSTARASADAAPPPTIRPELWDRVLAVNLTGTFNCCQAVGRAHARRRRGLDRQLASIGGLVGYAGSVGYQASKGGVVQLTRTLAVEWAARGVRVNAIAPCTFETPVVARQREAEPDLYPAMLARIPARPLRGARGDRRAGALPRLRRLVDGHRAHPDRRRGIHSPVTALPDPGTLLEIHRTMVRIRVFEERVQRALPRPQAARLRPCLRRRGGGRGRCLRRAATATTTSRRPTGATATRSRRASGSTG